jgi:hypothetical protein
VAIFARGWECGRNEAWRITGGAGLITVLTLITAVILAISGRYPQRIFDLVMGLNRWCYRVLAYVALMREEYPPSRLDTGGTDPGHLSPLPADRPRRSRPPQAATRDQYAPAGAPVPCPCPGKPFAEPGNESWLTSASWPGSPFWSPEAPVGSTVDVFAIEGASALVHPRE